MPRIPAGTPDTRPSFMRLQRILEFFRDSSSEPITASLM
jgi:hypothetical protein